LTVAGAAVTLDRASPVPLYRQVERILRDELLVADAIRQRLTENQLMSRFRVSRHTVREALALLSADGLIERWPRRGTFARLWQRSRLSVVAAGESIRAVVRDQRQSHLLKASRGGPAFFVERVSFGASGPLEVRHSLIRGDRYLYSVQLRAASQRELPAV